MNTIESTMITTLVLFLLMAILAIFIQTALVTLVKIDLRTQFLESTYDIHKGDMGEDQSDQGGLFPVQETSLGFVTHYVFENTYEIEHPLSGFLMQTPKVTTTYQDRIYKTRWWLVAKTLGQEVIKGVKDNEIRME